MWSVQLLIIAGLACQMHAEMCDHVCYWSTNIILNILTRAGGQGVSACAKSSEPCGWREIHADAAGGKILIKPSLMHRFTFGFIWVSATNIFIFQSARCVLAVNNMLIDTMWYVKYYYPECVLIMQATNITLAAIIALSDLSNPIFATTRKVIWW